MIGDPRVLQGLQVAVPLRHAARSRPRAGTTSSIGNFAKAQGAAEGGGLRRHAGRADAVDRHRRRSPTSRRSPSRCSRRPASRSTCRRWTGRRWSRAAPRRTRRTRAAGTPSSPHGRSVDILESGRRPPSSTPRATRRRSAGRATPRWRSCATPSPRRPIRPSRRRSPRRCRLRALEYPTHLLLGQYVQPHARSARTSPACSTAPVAGALEHRVEDDGDRLRSPAEASDARLHPAPPASPPSR